MKNTSILLAATTVATSTLVVHWVRHSDLYALLPPTTGLYEYFFSALTSIHSSLTTRQHFRALLCTHSTTVLVLFLVPPTTCLCHAFGVLRRRSSMAILLLWFVHFLRKLRASIGTNPFPAHVLALLKQAHEAETQGTRPTTPQHPPPTDLTTPELALLRFVKSITSDIAKDTETRSNIWGMRGGGKGEARQQLGFTSTRYHLAFTGYAFAMAQSRTPCYVGQARRVLTAIMDHMLDECVWGYLSHYWKEDPDPFRCPENIMWSGHVLQLATTYEALTGDDRYRRPGGLQTSSSTNTKVYVSDVLELAETLRTSMQNNPTGGIPCEPGLVFFQCNTHPQIGMKMLEMLQQNNGEAPRQSFGMERRRWEKHALSTMHSGIATGAFKMFSAAKQHASSEMGTIPFGHMGGDGWCLSYYFPWASSEKIPASIWYTITLPILQQFDTFDRPPAVAAAAAAAAAATTAVTGAPNCCGGPSSHSGSAATGSDEPNLCCFNLNIPSSAWASSLLPAAAQAQDYDTFYKIKRWLDEHYMRTDDQGRCSMVESIEWQIGNTMQYLLGLTIVEGSSFRQLVQQPKTKVFYEQGPLLVEVGGAFDVYRCYRTRREVGNGGSGGDGTGWVLHVGLDRGVCPLASVEMLELTLGNVARIDKVTRILDAASFCTERQQCKYEDGSHVATVLFGKSVVDRKIELELHCTSKYR